MPICTPTKEDEECFRIAKSHAEELESIYNGTTGLKASEEDEERSEDGEPITLSAWVGDQLDIEVRCSLKKEYASCEIAITLGGPTVLLDTGSREIICSWGSSRATYSVNPEVCEAIDEIVEEYWQSD